MAYASHRLHARRWQHLLPQRCRCAPDGAGCGSGFVGCHWQRAAAAVAACATPSQATNECRVSPSMHTASNVTTMRGTYLDAVCSRHQPLDSLDRLLPRRPELRQLLRRRALRQRQAIQRLELLLQLIHQIRQFVPVQRGPQGRGARALQRRDARLQALPAALRHWESRAPRGGGVRAERGARVPRQLRRLWQPGTYLGSDSWSHGTAGRSCGRCRLTKRRHSPRILPASAAAPRPRPTTSAPSGCCAPQRAAPGATEAGATGQPRC